MVRYVKEVHRFRNPISPAANTKIKQIGSDFDQYYYSKRAPHTFQIIGKTRGVLTRNIFSIVSG